MAEYMTQREAAAYLRVAPSTLQSKRSKGEGPRFVKAGGRVLYLKADLESWIRGGLL